MEKETEAQMRKRQRHEMAEAISDVDWRHTEELRSAGFLEMNEDRTFRGE